MQKFLRTLTLMAFMLMPWVMQAQNAKVSEYDYTVGTASFSSVASTGTAWTADDVAQGYVDVTMPFGMYFGENQVQQNDVLRVYPNGSVSFTNIDGSLIAPMMSSSAYTVGTTSIYYRSTTAALIIEWRKVVYQSNSYSFQLKLYNTGDIEFCYGPMTLNGNLSVLVGMRSSATDQFLCSGNDWSEIVRTNAWTYSHTVSAANAPYYNITSGEGQLYTFTQPACVKPTAISASATDWNKVNVEWTVAANGSKYEIAYSTDPEFDGSASGVARVTVNQGTASSYEVSGLQPSTTYYFAVRKYCNNTPSGWLYGASATTPSGCPSLSGITSSDVTATSATLSWSTSEPATSYDVRYNLGADFDPENNEGTLVTSTDLSKTLTGLTGASTYYYYVRANCVSSLTTNWYGPYTFNTLCGTQNVPYSIAFNSGAMPMCWSTDIVEGTEDWQFTSGSYAYFNYTDGAVGRLITPIFDISATGNYQVDFYHAETYDGDADDSLYVYYRTSATGEWVRLAELGSHQANGSINYTQTILALPNPSATYQLAFEGRGHYGYGVYLGGVSVGLEPTCPTPSGIAATAEGVVTWTAGNNNTSYDLVYGPAGFTSLAEGTLIENITGTTYTLTGLEGSTSYDVYVRAHCSATNETNDTWVGPANFTTACMPMNISATEPFVEGFEGTTIPGCWTIEYVSGSHDWVFNSYGDYSTSTGTHSGSHNALFKHTTTGTVTKLVSPVFNFASGNYSLSFWHIQRSWGSDIDNLKIYYRTSPSDDWTLLESYTGAIASWTQDEIALVNTSATYQIAFEATDNYGYGVGLDDISIVKLADCLNPVGLAASGVTATAATLTWTPRGTATQWEVKVGPRGFNPDEEGTSYIVNTTPTLALDYLYMVTEYDAYVRAICDPEGPTEWSNVCEFKTPCANGGNATIGTGTGTTSGVPVANYGSTYCQQIFTASELTEAGVASDISGLSFNWQAIDASFDKYFTIWMANTTQSSFASTSDFVPYSELTKVYGPVFIEHGTGAGEQEYTFTTPFHWDGTSNIVVVTLMNAGASDNNASRRAYTHNSGISNISMYQRRDYTPYTEDELATINGNGRSSYRSNITFIAPCDSGLCNAPQTAIALSETEYAATLTFTDVNEETNPSYGIVYGPQGFDPATAGTTVSPINASNYTISGLAARTSYDVYVYAICSGTNGRMVKYNFVTPFIPNCKTPIIDGEYGASNIAYNTATLTWRQPGSQPMFWTVRYADADFDPATAAATAYTELTVQGTAGATAQLTGLVAGTTYYVYIKATCSTAPDLDESPWLHMSNANPAYTFTTPACVEPTDVTASDVTNSTAMISWTEAGNATAWTVKYGPAGFDPDNEGTAVAVTADSVELTGLDAYTTFDVYVKANCTATDESDWSSVCTFRTVCPDGGDVEVAGITAGRSYYIPVNTYFNYSYTQQIITAEEIPGAGPIQGISLSYYHTAALDPSKYDVTIYIGTTDKASFASSSDFVDPATLTAVWHGTFNVEQGWNNFIFDTPFMYDGSSNIVVAFDDNVTGYNSTSHTFNTMTTSSPMTLSYHSDNNNPDATSAATLSAFSGTKTTYSYRNVMKLMANCNTDVTCFAPASISADVTPANVVTLNWAPRTDLRPIVNNYQVKYGPEGFNPDNQGILIDNLNNVTTTTINGGLIFEQNYDVYVRTVCGGGDYSKWTKGTFVTYPSCWAPVDLTVTGTTSNSATLTWANDSIAPTAGNRWEVAYGLEGFNPDDVIPVETTNRESFTVNGLRHSSKYEFYVRTKCSADDFSPWSAVASATTQCGAWQYADMPLIEDFDGVTGKTSGTAANHVLPNCWDYNNDATSSSYVGYPICYNSSSYSRSGNNHLRFYTNYSSSSTNYGNQIAIFPPMDFDVDTLNLEFYARKYSTSTTYQSNIIVGVMSDPEDASTFVEVATLHPTSTTYEPFLVEFSEYQGNGRYIAIKAERIDGTSGYNYVLIDDVTLKLREKVNNMPNNGGTLVACNEFVMPDTVNDNYAVNLNTTYVIRPAEAGKMARVSGSYDLENGYDFLYVYRGEGANRVIVDTLTGTGDYEYMAEGNDWVNDGSITLVLKSDADNGLDYYGFRFLVSCECPSTVDMPVETVEANGTYTWTEGNGLTYDNHSTENYALDRIENVDYTFTNVAGCDSVYRHLALTVHPDYTLNYTATICERDTFEFYGNTYTTAGHYTVTLQSVTGADSTGILDLTVNSAPLAYIYYNNRNVTAVENFCDNAPMTLAGQSNVATATYTWDGETVGNTYVVNPHLSNTYSVVATNPATGCTSLPTTVTVTTTPVPALTISGDEAICYGQSATLTLADANEVPATYRWSTAATTTSITENPNATTTYTVVATSTTGSCRDTAEFTVTVNALPVVEAVATPAVICQNDNIQLSATEVEGYSYSWSSITGRDGREVTVPATATGNFTVTVTDANGCVNEFTTNNVTVNPVYELNDEQSACVGMLPYTWGTQSLSEAGSYNQTFQTINSCDSTVHLTFIVQDTANTNTNREICEGATFTFGEGIYQQSYTATTSTVISYVDTTSGECPARFNLNLTVNTHNPATVENTVCDSYVWPLTGETYTESGAYQTMLQTTKGCDSLVTLNLTVNYQNTGIDEVVACDEYEWIDGITYYESNNTATKTLKNQWTCDSVVTLNLTINNRSYHEDFQRVCDAKTYTWIDGEVYNLDVALADSIQHVTGENVYGCLEIALLHLDMNYVSDTVRLTVDTCDEYVVDTVSCDNGVAAAYLRESGVYTLRVHNDLLNRDEIMILTLTVTPSTYHTQIVTECLPYTWSVYKPDSTLFEVATITADMVNGASVYNMSFDMSEAGFSVAGCSNIEVLRLTPKYPTEEVIEAAICENGTWMSPDSSVTINGSDLNTGLNTRTWATSTNEAGCDHEYKVALTVNENVEDSVNMTYCESQFINVDSIGRYVNYVDGNDTLPLYIDAAGLNQVAYEGSAIANWETATGCSRTVTVNYTVNPTIYEVETVESLTEYVWAENGKRYETIGHTFDTVNAINEATGCDLYKVLDLTITDSARVYDTILVCTSYEVDGVTYVEDNTFVTVDKDSNKVTYTTYHVLQNTFTEVNVVSNAAYTWVNGVTYTANASNVYYSMPSANSICDSVIKLVSFTMVPAISICEGELPYETAYGFTIDTAVSDVWHNNDANGNDTVIAYTVKLNAHTALVETACDSYVWNNTTYTESGVYTDTTAAVNGCDSIVTLTLTVNNSTSNYDTLAVCDSYTWHDSTYTASTTASFDTVNAAGCVSTAYLVLTVNKNNGVVETLTQCDSYEWNGQTFTESGDHTVTFADANNCYGDSVLHLTINNTVFANADSIVNAASTYYLGVLYNAPLDTVINDTLTAGAANGCDSITRMHLQVSNGVFIAFDTVVCGDYTWIDGNTYTWIPMSERLQHNPAINYKNRTTGEYVEEYPIVVVDANNDGIIDTTYVLYLNLAEASVEYKTVDVLLSNVNNANYAVDDTVFDFTAEKAAKKNATRQETIHYGSTFYCDSIVYYTFNLVYNYVDDDIVTVCYSDSVYTTQNGAEISLTVGENAFTDTTAAGTADEMVHNMVYVRSAAITGTETIAACDSVTWNNTLFTTNVVDSLVTLTALNSCDSVVTLNITITPTIHNVVEPADICDSYTWTSGDGETYTNDTIVTWSRTNATDAQCTDVDTLKLVVKHSTTGTDTQVACDTYTWIDDNTYTESNTTATKTLTNAAGCDSVVTLNLTVNYSFTGAGNDIDTLGASITLTDSLGSYIFIAPCDSNVTFTYKTVAGCDSIVSFHINVNQFQIVAENPIECGMYTWENAGHGTGHTYKWISDVEKSEHTITIPGISPMVPLYKDITTDLYVYSNPLDTVGDIVYLLNLNLNEAEFVDSTIARFPQSMNSLTLHGETIYFTDMTSATKQTADTVIYMTLPHETLCGKIMVYNVHVVYNYLPIAQTVCYTENYGWADGTTSAVVVGSNEVVNKVVFAGDMAQEVVYNGTITVRANNNTAEETNEACDSYTWHGNVYTATGDYTFDTVDQYGCDSVTTLHLTVKYNNNHVDEIAACDSTQWNGTWYYANTDSATYAYTHTNGCPSVDTLHLTINHADPQVTIESACDSYTWSLNSREYNASGNYTANRTDAVNGCQAVDTLKLTIRESTSYDSVMYVTDGSYRYTAQDNTTTLILAGQVATFAEHYTNVAQCDSTLNIEIHVGSGYFAAEDVVSCNEYTWRNGNTYVWISAEERAANGNALYKNQTTGAYVMSNPIYNVTNAGDYDSIYMLRLNLTQNYTEDFTIDFPISLGTLTYGDSTFNFETTNDEGREFVNTTIERDVHFASDYYCDSIHHLTINLINNYSHVDEDADICVTQTSFTWRGHEISTATNDYDNAHTYYMYDTVGTAEAPVIEYVKVTQHPVVYATERRTACDSYTWNGMPFTESTSNATFNTVNVWGCDSTVTLILTINHNSSKVTTIEACESYQWQANNAVQTIINTYTESGNYAYEYISDEGCPSTDSLYLTINTNSNTAYTVDECDSYTWNNMTLTASCDTVFAYDNEFGCPSVDTLHLTIRNNSNHGDSIVICDSYEWHDSTYTESTTAYFEYEAANGCASVDTLYLTINVNNGFAETLTACDSIDWNGHKYYETGVYTVNYADANGCLADSVLTLTVNYATHNYDTVVACDSYNWHGIEFTTGGLKSRNYTNNESCPSKDYLRLTLYHSDYNGVNYATQTVSDYCGDYTWIVNDSVIGTYTESVETSTQFTSPVTTCDSVIFLNLTIKNAPVIDTAATVCENTLPYEWRGIMMNEAGVETVTFPLENGCDSTIRFTLNVNPKYEVVHKAEVCLGSGYTDDLFDINAEEMPEVGEYNFVYNGVTEYGCDSVVTLTVSVKTLFASTVEATACDSYIWDLNGETYSESGEYVEHLSALNNCDSVVTLVLTINNATTGVDEQVACNRFTWIDGETYTASNNTATFTLENANGCDSVVTLNLTVNYTTYETLTEVACDSYVWNGATYTQSGSYTNVGENENGCEKIVTLDLTINHNTDVEISDVACDSYEWFGETYTESGVYNHQFADENGCLADSILTLVINTNNGVEISETACESYEWYGETLSIDGDYTHQYTDANGCVADSVLHLTVLQPIDEEYTATACDGYTWSINGQNYYESGIYEAEINGTNGCPATATLNLTVNASSQTSLVQAACGSFEWNGDTLTATGLYTYATTNIAGCDSIVTLSLVINQSVYATETATACDSYEWNGETYTESGVYTFNSTTDEGCESITTLLLTIKNSTNNAENVTICDSYTWNNTEYTTSGDYYYSYTNAAGCASTDTLHLTINASTEETVNATACDSYTWSTGNGMTYTESGTYTFNTTNANGCAHVATLALTINSSSSSTENVTVCGGYTWNGQTYAQSGVYTYNTTNAAGCDSVATLILSINQPYVTTVNQTACDSYEWNGQTYTTSGNYTYNYTASNNCDSAVTLVLTINQSKTTTFADNTCDVYTWNGQTYTTSGQYEQTLTARNGCDSVVTLNLTVLEPINTSATESACESYTWSVNGQTYTQSGTYTANITGTNGCPATATLALTVNNAINTSSVAEACNSYTWTDGDGQTYTQSGDYTRSIIDVHGCVATDTLHLTINGSTSETVNIDACDSYTWSNGNGNTYTEDGIYTYNTTNEYGCSHVITLVLNVNQSVTVDTSLTVTGSYTWHGETYTESGTYIYTGTAANGCDSTTILQLTVQPAITYYTVTLTSANSGMGTVSEGGVFAEGTAFTAVATANDGYEFVNWTNEAGEVVSQLAEYTFTVTSDVNLTANFVYVPIYFQVNAQVYTVMHNADGTNDTVIGEHGQVLGTGEYESNATVTLTAVADSGYHFVCWSNGYNTATITFTVTNDMNLIAYFEQDQATPQAIVETDMSNVVIFSVDTKIIVRGVEGNDVYVFDVNGRMLDHKLNAADEVEFRMAATGVYLVKVGNAPAKRVLVVR